MCGRTEKGESMTSDLREAPAGGKITLSVAVPVYNEAEIVDELAARLREA